MLSHLTSCDAIQLVSISCTHQFILLLVACHCSFVYLDTTLIPALGNSHINILVRGITIFYFVALCQGLSLYITVVLDYVHDAHVGDTSLLERAFC